MWNARFFKQYLLLFALNQMAASLFRFIAGAARNMIVANVFGAFMLLIFMVLGGFILVRGTPSPCFFKKTKRITSLFFLYVVLFIIALFSKKKVGASFFLNLQIK